jgi:hypothetical protein
LKTRIHINRNIIDSNRKHGKNDPPVTVKTGRLNRYGHEVQILGPSLVVHRPDAPLSCGARIWIETEAEVIIT